MSLVLLNRHLSTKIDMVKDQRQEQEVLELEVVVELMFEKKFRNIIEA